MPQVINVEELVKAKEILKEINFDHAKLGIMIETPAAVQLIQKFCDEGIDFISFGTNDLTQYMLAVDRGNEQVQNLYDEMHPAILYQLGFVIRVCKRNNVETSICGQAGSKKEMIKFLVEKGIDSITVNADVAKNISEYVEELEKELVKGTDKESRQYQSEKRVIIEDGREKQRNNLDYSDQKEIGEEDEEYETNIEKEVKETEREKQEYLNQHAEEHTKEENHEISKSNKEDLDIY